MSRCPVSDAEFVRVTVKIFGSFLARPAPSVERLVDSIGMTVPFFDLSDRTDTGAAYPFQGARRWNTQHVKQMIACIMLRRGSDHLKGRPRNNVDWAFSNRRHKMLWVFLWSWEDGTTGRQKFGWQR